MTLVFATFGFGTDRFYVGQTGLGIGLLVSYISVFGLIVAFPISMISCLSLLIAIFGGYRTVFMYGQHVVFDAVSTLDKILAVVWVFLAFFFILLGILASVINFRA
jgi:TM2 domain-containing membrane protein YozV